MSTTEVELTKLRRRRGVSKASITRIRTRMEELEGLTTHPTTSETAKQLSLKLDSLDSEFKSYHFQIVDLLADEASLLEREQDVLDGHDDLISDLTVRLQKLCSLITPSTSINEVCLLGRKLEHLCRCINAKKAQIAYLDEESELATVEQYQVQLVDYQSSLKLVHEDLLSVEDQSTVERELAQHSELEDTLFECSSTIRKLLKGCPTGSTSSGSGVKLPKIDVPTFDGDILQWKQFWEQFCVAVHNRVNLTDSEKMVYLRHALKTGTAKSIIEGLSQSGDQYEEAIKCLTSRFDRPRLVHQTHVRTILETPQLREGNGKELRRLHDTVQQHIRALKSMGEEPSASFITSIIELKLDTTTMFEWQRHTQSSSETPHYSEILEFLDHRAQASEVSSTPSKKPNKVNGKRHNNQKSLPSYATINGTESTDNHCPLCNTERHLLYSCSKFKSLPHDRKIATIKTNNLCVNCLGKGHFVAECKSLQRCKKCHNSHHMLLHNDEHRKENHSSQSRSTSSVPPPIPANNAVAKVNSETLLMTCRVVIIGPNGSSVKARALLDSASSTSFISKRLTQVLRLKCKKSNIIVSGVGSLPSKDLVKSITNFTILPVNSSDSPLDVSALVVPRVTCNLPTVPISSNRAWSHLDKLPLADPEFGVPGRIDILLGVDVFTQVLLDGRKKGPRDSPVAMETTLGWVLCGNVSSSHRDPRIISCHTMINSEEDIIRRFWEIEETPAKLQSTLSIEERTVMNHFKEFHVRKPNGSFVVPLPKKSNRSPLGESRSQAVRRFLALERSLTSKNRFSEVDEVMNEYFDMKHAEVVPPSDLSKPVGDTFYLPIHAVYKETSSTTKVRAVFDASAKSSTGVSLNDILLVGPTIHPPLIDVLLRFRQHRIALTADVSKLY